MQINLAITKVIDEVQQEAMADFKSQPPEVQQQQLDEIRSLSLNNVKGLMTQDLTSAQVLKCCLVMDGSI